MYLVQVVRGFCRWSGTDIPGKRSFDSLDIRHAPGDSFTYWLFEVHSPHRQRAHIHNQKS